MPTSLEEAIKILGTSNHSTKSEVTTAFEKFIEDIKSRKEKKYTTSFSDFLRAAEYVYGDTQEGRLITSARRICTDTFPSQEALEKLANAFPPNNVASNEKLKAVFRIIANAESTFPEKSFSSLLTSTSDLIKKIPVFFKTIIEKEASPSPEDVTKEILVKSGVPVIGTPGSNDPQNEQKGTAEERFQEKVDSYIDLHKALETRLSAYQDFVFMFDGESNVDDYLLLLKPVDFKGKIDTNGEEKKQAGGELIDQARELRAGVLFLKHEIKSSQITEETKNLLLSQLEEDMNDYRIEAVKEKPKNRDVQLGRIYIYPKDEKLEYTVAKESKSTAIPYPQTQTLTKDKLCKLFTDTQKNSFFSFTDEKADRITLFREINSTCHDIESMVEKLGAISNKMHKKKCIQAIKDNEHPKHEPLLEPASWEKDETNINKFLKNKNPNQTLSVTLDSLIHYIVTTSKKTSQEIMSLWKMEENKKTRMNRRIDYVSSLMTRFNRTLLDSSQMAPIAADMRREFLLNFNANIEIDKKQQEMNYTNLRLICQVFKRGHTIEMNFVIGTAFSFIQSDVREIVKKTFVSLFELHTNVLVKYLNKLEILPEKKEEILEEKDAKEIECAVFIRGAYANRLASYLSLYESTFGKDETHQKLDEIHQKLLGTFNQFINKANLHEHIIRVKGDNSLNSDELNQEPPPLLNQDNSSQVAIGITADNEDDEDKKASLASEPQTQHPSLWKWRLLLTTCLLLGCIVISAVAVVVIATVAPHLLYLPIVATLLSYGALGMFGGVAAGAVAVGVVLALLTLLAWWAMSTMSAYRQVSRQSDYAEMNHHLNEINFENSKSFDATGGKVSLAAVNGDATKTPDTSTATSGFIHK